MRKYLVLCMSIILLVGIFVSTDMVQAGDCYQDPVYSVDWTGQVKISCFVRTGACMEGTDILSTIPQGSTVSIIGHTDGWYKVRLADGSEGWSGATLINVVSKNGSQVKINETAKPEELSPTPVLVEEQKKVKTDSTLNNRVRGYILLQVEDHGEAWYVHPDSGKRYYMRDGETAYNMMRYFGLGISNADLDKAMAGNQDLINRLRGKIVLQVELHGEAYYIHPKDGSIHYLKDGAEAYRIMRELSLGITNNDLGEVPLKDFDSYVAERETGAVYDTADDNGGITLNGSVSNGTVNLIWSVDDIDVSQGFKVVYANTANPVYPGNTYHYLTNTTARSDSWFGLGAGIYHFRVCQYLGGKCGVYSNDVPVTIGVSNSESEEGSITLSGHVEAGKVYLNWAVDGVDVSKGFKVVISEDANPVYPGNTYHYLTNSSVRSDSWVDLDAGSYHFRVCQYLGGACGVYSNDIDLMIMGSSSSQVSPSTYQQGVIPVGVDLEELNNYWLNKINNLRATASLRELVLEQRWIDTATEWASYMGANNVATHDRSDGLTMHQWIGTKNLDFTERYSVGGWQTNYFTENIAWGLIGEGTTANAKTVLDETLAMYLNEASWDGPHYRTIYHEDWNSIGAGFYFKDQGNGGYKVYMAFHYGSLVL